MKNYLYVHDRAVLTIHADSQEAAALAMRELTSNHREWHLDSIEDEEEGRLPEGHRITEILQHEIEYWYTDDYEGMMSECDIEHITKCIQEGYHQGELNTLDGDQEHRGWWGIR